ncbi:hypothetical protein HUT19_33905 [Streptomyces sp. NA02950]|uniref:hypothetical protein n=1 Tax=Streptomyces sp. NA02950 TaxID=2742137 RepID=UPI001590179D|nr:hypothetical protein [Streptomyces sp. NA02950]QKV96105.1 hypothetical protein HUT19_33905 [Streptomyces sp. NA02950]
MPTDHACRTAAELAARSLAPLAASPGTTHHGRRADGAEGLSAGIAALLAVLDGLWAGLTGELSEWHAGLGDRIHGALGFPAAGTEGLRPARQPSGWQGLTLIQVRAQEVLTALVSRPHGGRALPSELARHLDLVEDVLAGALRRTAVSEGTAVRCATGLAAAAGSLFGLSPSPPPRTAPHHSEPPHPARPAPPVQERRPPVWWDGLP